MVSCWWKITVINHRINSMKKYPLPLLIIAINNCQLTTYLLFKITLMRHRYRLYKHTDYWLAVLRTHFDRFFFKEDSLNYNQCIQFEPHWHHPNTWDFLYSLLFKMRMNFEIKFYFLFLYFLIFLQWSLPSKPT